MRWHDSDVRVGRDFEGGETASNDSSADNESGYQRESGALMYETYPAKMAPGLVGPIENLATGQKRMAPRE